MIARLSSPLSDGSILCLACGLCCSGVLFGYARLHSDETDLAHSLGLTVGTFNDHLGFGQPCPHHVDQRCSIYTASRPRVCGSYQCSLLKKLHAGQITLEQGLHTVSRAHNLVAEVTAQLPPGTTFLQFRQAAETSNHNHPPALMLALAKLARYLQKHFDTPHQPISGVQS